MAEKVQYVVSRQVQYIIVNDMLQGYDMLHEGAYDRGDVHNHTCAHDVTCSHFVQGFSMIQSEINKLRRTLRRAQQENTNLKQQFKGLTACQIPKPTPPAKPRQKQSKSRALKVALNLKPSPEEAFLLAREPEQGAHESVTDSAFSLKLQEPSTQRIASLDSHAPVCFPTVSGQCDEFVAQMQMLVLQVTKLTEKTCEQQQAALQLEQRCNQSEHVVAAMSQELNNMRDAVLAECKSLQKQQGDNAVAKVAHPQLQEEITPAADLKGVSPPPLAPPVGGINFEHVGEGIKHYGLVPNNCEDYLLVRSLVSNFGKWVECHRDAPDAPISYGSIETLWMLPERFVNHPTRVTDGTPFYYTVNFEEGDSWLLDAAGVVFAEVDSEGSESESEDEDEESDESLEALHAEAASLCLAAETAFDGKVLSASVMFHCGPPRISHLLVSLAGPSSMFGFLCSLFRFLPLSAFLCNDCCCYPD